jgi:hypothetical protein
MSFCSITLCVASQRVFIIVAYFVIESVRKLLDTPSYRKSLCLREGVLQFFEGFNERFPKGDGTRRSLISHTHFITRNSGNRNDKRSQ